MILSFAYVKKIFLTIISNTEKTTVDVSKLIKIYLIYLIYGNSVAEKKQIRNVKAKS